MLNKTLWCQKVKFTENLKCQTLWNSFLPLINFKRSLKCFSLKLFFSLLTCEMCVSSKVPNADASSDKKMSLKGKDANQKSFLSLFTFISSVHAFPIDEWNRSRVHAWWFATGMCILVRSMRCEAKKHFNIVLSLSQLDLLSFASSLIRFWQPRMGLHRPPPPPRDLFFAAAASSVG